MGYSLSDKRRRILAQCTQDPLVVLVMDVTQPTGRSVPLYMAHQLVQDRPAQDEVPYQPGDRRGPEDAQFCCCQERLGIGSPERESRDK